MDPTQFLVTTFSPMSSGSKCVVWRGVFICQGLSKQPSLIYCLLMLLKH